MQDEFDGLKKVQLSTWKRVIDIVFQNKSHLVKLGLFMAGITVLDIIFPQLNRYAIDVFFIEKNMETLIPFIIISVLVASGFGLLVWAFIKQAILIEATVSHELRRQAFDNLQRLSFSYFDKTPQGWVMARMTSDASRLSEVISWGLLDMLWAFFSMIFITVALLATNIRLGLIIVTIIPIMFLISQFFRKRILTQERLSKKHNSHVTAQFSEAFLGAKTTKSLVIETENFTDFYQSTGNLKRAGIKSIMLSAVYTSVLLVIAYVAVSVTMVTGSIAVLDQIITVGTLQLIIAYTINFFEPMLVISEKIADLQNAQASAERIVELIETQPEIVDKKEVEDAYGSLLHTKKDNWETIQGQVSFKDLTFYYKDDEIILDHFNLDVKKGQSVALVGHTGSGKTTLINLLSRFYEPKSGRIEIDGKDYRERSLQWLHQQLGYVLQSPQLFSTSIKENILYGRLDATDEEVIVASKAIGLHPFIMTLEKGYDSEVGEGGNLLSIGQKQLISFARALIANPRILILDEATSSIDSESELIIQEATKTILKDRTSFIVAHRLSTIVEADIIVMLEMGKIIEKGTHEELIAKKGHYYQLYKNQFFSQQGLIEDWLKT
ncbi:MAG: ABC transporter ATP-binding protein [Firmicutes bacterium]|nr:ABC transporter ATP-binding protein [Bacillota bacterium]